MKKKRMLQNELENILEKIRMQRRKDLKEKEELLKLGDIRKGIRVTCICLNEAKTYDAGTL
jgi:hypothetical protein